MYISREEFLTEAAVFWNLRKIKSLPKMLMLQLKKVCFCVLVTVLLVKLIKMDTTARTTLMLVLSVGQFLFENM